MRASTDTWSELNRTALDAEVARVRTALEAHRDRRAVAPPPAGPPGQSADPPAVETLVTLFGLTSFERDVLALCAAVELDPDVPPLCAAVHGDERRPYPTFGLALAVFPEPHWSAVVPSAPLRTGGSWSSAAGLA